MVQIIIVYGHAFFFTFFYNIAVNRKLGKEQIIEIVMWFNAGQIAWINSQGTHLELCQKKLS
jgi:hypothetical protein